MGKHRSSYSPQFKAQVALEALRGERSQAAIAGIHTLNGEVVSRWRQHLVQSAAEVFASPAGTSAEQQRIAELERLVGELTLELSASKRPNTPAPTQAALPTLTRIEPISARSFPGTTPDIVIADWGC